MNFARLEAIAAEVVATTRRRLPPEIRAAAAPVAVHCQPVPDAAVLREGFEPDILGLFVGPAVGAEPGPHPEPSQILLFLENLWDFAEGDLDLYRDEVRITYLHELGHFLGLDEDALEARGLD